MIKRLKYSEIDFDKYSKCLNGSVQKNWYAQKEILDVLSGNWQILVYGDYDAVMPIPLIRKTGIDIVSMPLFCQQLGIFSKIDNPQTNDKFLKFLKKNYTIFYYCFNNKNRFLENLDKKKNYIIPISDYAVLKRKKYFKGRKSTVKWAQHLFYREINLDADSISFIENNVIGLSKKSDIEKLKKYIEFLNSIESLKLCGAYLNEELINLAVLIREQEQFSLLSLANNDFYKNENGASFLIDKILENYIHKKSFNFMGSNIRGIEIFFKSFGGELEEYGFIQNKFLQKIFTIKNALF
ncbi:MAG: hypothetical protein LBE36_00770 [Flavobacteriaceae bacterium]|jgi:hypothetical protein|nr:hypothetical protein [Flavobacteriaceae bacterium]